MTERDDGPFRLSRDDEAFVQRVATAYTAPPMRGPRRTRFDARLEGRIADDVPRRRPWLVVSAVGAAVLALVVWRAPQGARDGVSARRAAAVAPLARASSAEEAILALAVLPVADADDALPDDYRVIADLMVGD